MLQVDLYRFLMWKCRNEVITDFYFDVASSKNNKAKVLYLHEPEFDAKMQEVEELLIAAWRDIHFMLEMDNFEIRPSIENCEACEHPKCKYRTDLPLIYEL